MNGGQFPQHFHSAKNIVKDYQERVQYFCDDNVIFSNYVKNFS